MTQVLPPLGSPLESPTESQTGPTWSQVLPPLESPTQSPTGSPTGPVGVSNGVSVGVSNGVSNGVRLERPGVLFGHLFSPQGGGPDRIFKPHPDLAVWEKRFQSKCRHIASAPRLNDMFSTMRTDRTSTLASTLCFSAASIQRSRNIPCWLPPQSLLG